MILLLADARKLHEFSFYESKFPLASLRLGRASTEVGHADKGSRTQVVYSYFSEQKGAVPEVPVTGFLFHADRLYK